MKIAAILPFILLAVACTGGEGENDALPAPADTTVVPANVTEPDEAALVKNVKPAPSLTSTAASATTFPAAFQGRWGITANDCDPSRDDNKGLMTISADTLEFYESRAKPDGLTIDSLTKITARLNWSGEGQTWRTTTILKLSNGEKFLVRENLGEGAIRYSKCAN